MHYWRLEREAWEPGLMQLRDLGLPIVETDEVDPDIEPWLYAAADVHEGGVTALRKLLEREP